MSQNNENNVSYQKVLKVEDLSYEFDGKTEKVKLIHRIAKNEREIELCFDTDDDEEVADYETSSQTEEIESVPSSSHETLDSEEVDEQIESESDANIKTAVQNVADHTEAPRLSNSTVGVQQSKNIPSKSTSAANQEIAESTEDHSLLLKLISEIQDIFDESNEPVEAKRTTESSSVSFHRGQLSKKLI